MWSTLLIAILSQPTIEQSSQFGGHLEGLPEMESDAHFGVAVAVHEDILAAGAPGHGDLSQGGVWIIPLHSNGSAASYVLVGHGTEMSAGGYLVLEDRSKFGSSLAWLDDLDGDGRAELAVGATEELSSGGYGSVYVFSSPSAYPSHSPVPSHPNHPNPPHLSSSHPTPYHPTLCHPIPS